MNFFIKGLLYISPIFSSFIAPNEIIINTWWGPKVQTLYAEHYIEPGSAYADVLKCDAINRLQELNQYGIMNYIRPTYRPYNRYQHSIGVAELLHRFGASEKEVIAGLTHDASHGAFSHALDHLGKQNSTNQLDEAYQDTHHSTILSKTDLVPCLKKHNFSLLDIDPKNGCFPMLEQNLPDICADRLEYVLYGGYAEGWFTKKDITFILNGLRYSNGRWYFVEIAPAKKFALMSIKLCDEIFTSIQNNCSYSAVAQAMMRATEIGAISFNDILYMKDDEMLQILLAHYDDEIARHMHTIFNIDGLYELSDSQDCSLECTNKFRGINPWILTQDEIFMRLTDIDDEFKGIYEKKKRKISCKQYYKLDPAMRSFKKEHAITYS